MMAAFKNLRTCQRQLDMDGCEVGVSRQALDEVLAEYEALLAALQELHLKTVVGTDAERHAALDDAWAAITKATGNPSPTEQKAS